MNDYLQDSPFRYESLASFVAHLRPGDHMVSWDICDAFHHIPIKESDQQYLAFVLGGTLYYPLSLPFGLKLAPWALTKVLRPVLAYLRSKGFPVLRYMDDFASLATGARPGSKARATAARCRAVAVFRRLRFQIHPSKGAVEAKTSLNILGFRVDTVRRLLLLPPRRLDTVVCAAMSLHLAASSHCRWVRVGALQRFCGLAVSYSAAVPMVRFHLYALYRCMPTRRRSQLQISTAAMTELTWWARLDSSSEVGRAVWQQPVVAELTTDACGYGWGAVLNRSVPARGFFSSADQADHINVQELRSLDKALDCWPNLCGPGVLRLRLDNSVNVSVVNNMTTRSPALMEVLDRILHRFSAWGLRAEATWLSSVANSHADKLSRNTDSSDWRLRPDIFRVLNAAWGPLQIGRLATADNTQLRRFNSRVMSPGTEAINARLQPSGRCRNYLSPPLSQMDLVLPKLQRDLATAVVLVPHWPASPWWRPLLMASSAAVHLPYQASLFTHGRWSTPARQPTWRTAATLIECGGRPPTAWPGGTSPTPAPWPPRARIALARPPPA